MFLNSKLLFPLFLFLLASIITKAEEIKNGYETKNYGDFSLTGKFKNGKPDGVMEYSSSDGTKKTYFYADGVIQENEVGGIEVAKYKCEKIGFKKQTEKFANCVLELYKKNNTTSNSSLSKSNQETKSLPPQPVQEISSPSRLANYAEDQKKSKERQKGIDSLNCEAYAKNSTSNQQPAVAYGDRYGITGLLSATLMGMNTQDYYDSCMKRLGY